MRYEITYMQDDIEVTVEAEFTATENITALEWCEDYAYSLADKGWYTVEEI